MSRFEAIAEFSESAFDDKLSVGNGDFTDMLMLVEVTEKGEFMADGQAKPKTIATVTVLDGPRAGEVHESIAFFGVMVQDQLKADAPPALGRLTKKKRSEKSRGAAWLLEPPTDDDIKLAESYLDSQSESKAPAATKPKPPWEK